MPLPLIAAGLGALATYAGNKYAADAAAESRAAGLKYLQQMQGQTNADYDKMYSDIQGYYKTRGGLGTADDVSAYRKAISGYNPESFVYDIDSNPFEFNKTAEDYINPYYDKIIGDTAATVQHTAAGAGLGRGSGAANAIAEAVAQKNEQLYNDAYDRFTNERAFAYNKYADYIQNRQNQLSQLKAATDTKLNLQSNLASDYYSVMDAQQSDLLKAQQDKMAAGTSYAAAMAGLY